MDTPKYRCGDAVTFTHNDKQYNGIVVVVDFDGTFEQHEEPSYDIYAFLEDGRICNFKHFRQSQVKPNRYMDSQELNKLRSHFSQTYKYSDEQ